MNSEDIRLCRESPVAFRDRLVIQAAVGRRRFGEILADFQRRDFAALDTALLALRDGRKPEPGRFWIERTKGASKDTDLAVALLWLLAFSPRPLACQVGAADADQADELRKAAKGILRLNPWLADVLEVQSWSVINRRTESRCDIIAADVAGSHGARPDLLILNELSHVTKREFAENLLDNASKMPNGVVIIATNAGFVPSWQWDWREQARTSGRWYFSNYQEPAPWLDPEEIKDAEKRNTAARFARLWRGVWVGCGGDALEPGDIKAAVRSDLRPMEGGEPGYVFIGGLDLGVKSDHAAFLVLGKHVGYVEPEFPEQEPEPCGGTLAALRELGLLTPDTTREPTYRAVPPTGRLRLALCESWAPPKGGQIDLEEVERAILADHQRFRIAALLYDPYQCALMAQRLARRGVPMIEQVFSGRSLSAMASVFLEEFKARTLDLYPDDQLTADLGKLRIVERPFGYRIEAPRDASGHCDRATSLGLALLGARKFCFVGGQQVHGELVCSPAFGEEVNCGDYQSQAGAGSDWTISRMGL
jgi:hypothetical protein